ncbi:MAG: hypothetical protein K0S01_2419 [Herbinix sp.]|jgi:hypothetical protein|nr:hypothetical protein [Herbinix sp.]
MGGERLRDQKKVVKFKRRRSINIGIIVFLILFLYIAINVFIYFTKEPLSIYEVHEGTTAIDNRITGLILRQEKVITSEKAGFITYYQKDGARVAKNSSIYSIDDSGQMLSVITSGEIPVTLSDKNNSEIRHEIKSFQNSFSDDNYTEVYDFKENAQSTVLDILNSAMISNGQALMEEEGISFSYEMVPSLESGIITYYTDSFETVTPESVTPEMFELEKYKRTGLRTTEALQLNSPIYKLITSEDWNLVLPLTEEQYGKLTGKDHVSFTILEDEFEMTAKLELTQRGSDYYAVLTMDKHLENYISERYLDVELDFDSVNGLKIPLSSIVEKDFFLVPLEYFSLGAESKENGLIKETYSKTGEVTFTFVPTEIYYQDDSYAYVDALEFEAGTWIQSATNSDRYQISQMNKLTGVYNVNLGYAVFKRIDILFQNEEYCIVDKKTANGLSAYDHIALDGKTAVDQGIIY